MCEGKEEYTFIGIPSSDCEDQELKLDVIIPGEGKKTLPFTKNGAGNYQEIFAFNDCPSAFQVISEGYGKGVSFSKITVEGAMNKITVVEDPFAVSTCSGTSD